MYKWSDYDHLLGKMCDKDVAALVKCSRVAVATRRKQLGIEAVGKKRWTKDDDARLIEGKIKCVKCNETKDKGEFLQNKDSPRGYRKQCKTCYHALQKQRQLERKKVWVDRLGGKCSSCEFAKLITPLQFHHVDPNLKEYGPTEIIYSSSENGEEIESEIDKCCLLCVNCHTSYHSGELPLEFVKCEFGWKVLGSVT